MKLIVIVHERVSNCTMSFHKYDNFCELTNQNIPYHMLITTKTLRPRSCEAKELNLL